MKTQYLKGRETTNKVCKHKNRYSVLTSEKEKLISETLVKYTME